jgi:hypothetical protein
LAGTLSPELQVRNLLALALGLLFIGLGLYGAAAVTPIAFPAAYTAQGNTRDLLALCVMLAITEVFAAFGGWVTARLVTDHRIGHALFMSIMGLALAVFIGAVRWASAPPWYFVLSWILMPVAAAIGASAWERSLRRQSRPETATRIAAH